MCKNCATTSEPLESAYLCAETRRIVMDAVMSWVIAVVTSDSVDAGDQLIAVIVLPRSFWLASPLLYSVITAFVCVCKVIRWESVSGLILKSALTE